MNFGKLWGFFLENVWILFYLNGCYNFGKFVVYYVLLNCYYLIWFLDWWYIFEYDKWVVGNKYVKLEKKNFYDFYK